MPQNRTSFKSYNVKFSKKFVSTVGPYMADPINPTKM
jgi:hypothetical protein